MKLESFGSYFSPPWNQSWLGVRVLPDLWAGDWPEWKGCVALQHGMEGPPTVTSLPIPLWETSVPVLRLLTFPMFALSSLISIQFTAGVAKMYRISKGE